MVLSLLPPPQKKKKLKLISLFIAEESFKKLEQARDVLLNHRALYDQWRGGGFAKLGITFNQWLKQPALHSVSAACSCQVLINNVHWPAQWCSYSQCTGSNRGGGCFHWLNRRDLNCLKQGELELRLLPSKSLGEVWSVLYHFISSSCMVCQQLFHCRFCRETKQPFEQVQEQWRPDVARLMYVVSPTVIDVSIIVQCTLSCSVYEHTDGVEQKLVVSSKWEK